MRDLIAAQLDPLYRLRSETYRLLQAALIEQQQGSRAQPPEAVERIRTQHQRFHARIQQIESTLRAAHQRLGSPLPHHP